MNRRLPLSLLALALLAVAGLATATEMAIHNDMDGDSKSDLIWHNASTGAIVYWPAADYGLRKSVTIGNPGIRTTPVFAFTDVWSWDRPRVMLLLRDASTGFQYQVGIESQGASSFYFKEQPVAVGDFNGNGAADAFIRSDATGKNSFLFEFGWAPPTYFYDVLVSYSTGTAPAVALSWKVAGIGDFDGDGRSDILWRNATTGRNAIWRSGNSATGLGIATVSNLDWKIAAIGDFNGDGRSDILWRNTRSGVNVIWRSGNVLDPQAVATVTDQRWKVVATGDFNGDGKWDLVWRHATTGADVLWKSANSATRETLPTVSLAWSLLM
jgi:hypothetical protein